MPTSHLVCLRMDIGPWKTCWLEFRSKGQSSRLAGDWSLDRFETGKSL